MTAPIVPLISSSVSGPLGVRHLPRVWLKVSLHGVGRLPDGYRHGSGGLDELMLRQLGIDPAEFVAFVEAELPSYLACEAWVRTHAKSLNAETIAEINDAIAAAQKSPESAAEFRAAFGIDDPSFVGGVAINDLDDWSAVHAEILASRSKQANG